MMASFTVRTPKDPADVLTYKFDFAPLTNGTGASDWLGSGETISSHTVTGETGITVDSSSITDSNTSVTCTLSGGTDKQSYDVVCQIVTSAGQTLEKTLNVNVSNN